MVKRSCFGKHKFTWNRSKPGRSWCKNCGRSALSIRKELERLQQSASGVCKICNQVMSDRRTSGTCSPKCYYLSIANGYGKKKRPKPKFDGSLRAIKDRCRVDGDGCWLWLGCLNKGIPSSCKKSIRVLILERAEKISSNTKTNTTCRKKLCVNPKHVTTGFYVQPRGWEPCVNGHDPSERDKENGRGERVCAQCHRERSARYYAANKAKCYAANERARRARKKPK